MRKVRKVGRVPMRPARAAALTLALLATVSIAAAFSRPSGDPQTRALEIYKSFKSKDLTDAAFVDARIAMELCHDERPPMTPLGAHPDRHIVASVVGRRTS